MTVWVVTWHNPGLEFGIEAVFTTKELAKIYVKKTKKTEKYSWFKIKEVILDPV